MLVGKGGFNSLINSILLILALTSCETPQQSSSQMPPEFRNNPEAIKVWQDLTEGGKTLPSAEALALAVKNPGNGMDSNCSPTVRMSTKGSNIFNDRTSEYNITNQAQRIALIDEIINAGPDRFGTTTLKMANDETYEVMNDNVTLPDGTYVPLTFLEAQTIARAWGYQLPTSEQAIAIGRLAAANGNQFAAIPREPNNGTPSQLRSMNAMMNDPRMYSRAQAGQDRLIDGHFKWYTDTGRIFGFARGDGKFYQNTPSAAHVGDPTYYDYSHGVRLIKRVQ